MKIQDKSINGYIITIIYTCKFLIWKFAKKNPTMSCTQEIFIFIVYPLLSYRMDNLFIHPHQQKFACCYTAVGKELTQRTYSLVEQTHWSSST